MGKEGKQIGAERSNETKEDSLDDFKRFSQAKRIADIVFKELDSINRAGGKFEMVDLREDEVNPYSNQTKIGFFIEVNNGTINELWTPWGTYKFGGSSIGDEDSRIKHKEAVLDRLGAKLHKPKEYEYYGEVGPIYKVSKIDNVSLPSPVEKTKEQFAPYDKVKTSWRSLTKKYSEPQIEQSRK